MALTPKQEVVLETLNQKAQAQHEEALRTAASFGKPAPLAPTPLRADQVEYPKYLHKDWARNDGKAADNVPPSGHHVPGKSILVRNTKEEEAAVAEGFAAGHPDLEGKAPKKTAEKSAPTKEK